MEPREVYEFIATTVIQDGPEVVQDFPQDPGQAGKDQKRHIRALIRDLAAEHPELDDVVVRFSPETGSKETRATGLAGDAEAGNLYLERGPWNDAFINECVNFPASKFKDQVDGASRAHARAVREPIVDSIVGPELIEG
jgi:predicted phage terminase large subunit-like protein